MKEKLKSESFEIDELHSRLKKSAEKLNAYIQGNGNSKKLKKKSKECVSRLVKAKD